MAKFARLHQFDPLTPVQTVLVGAGLAVGCGIVFAILAAVHFNPDDRVWGSLVLIGLFGIVLVILGVIHWIGDERQLRRDARATLAAQRRDD